MSFLRGSEWRKWDLHFHTPSSYDYKDKSITNDQIIQTLIDNGISIVAITDHHTIDIDRIINLQELGKDKITILPGIEFLSETRGAEPIHFIGIFSEDCTKLEYIWGQIENLTRIKQIKESSKKPNEIYCDLEDTINLIHQLGGLVSIHAGGKHSSIENITHSLPHTTAQKTDIAKLVDFYELGKATDQSGYKEKVFPHINKYIPMIICSDNHNIKNYEIKDYCWIKANPTFEGLKQVVHEPKDRVFIGELPPKLNLVHTNKDKYIEKITIEKIHGSTEPTIWFNNTVELNSDLVAIIGNKGNGKSALADIIALSGHAKLIDHADYSFLNNDRFHKHNLAANFQSTLIWKNGTNTIINLNDEVKETDIEKIKYLPQKYIEKICSSDEYLSFQQEINKVVFSHIKEENKLGKTNLKDLIKEKTQYITDKRTEIINQIKNLIQEHIDLTSKYSKTELSKKENLLKEKEQQIADHQKIKAEITIVENPSNNTGLQAQQKEKVTQTEQLSTSINELKKAIDVNQSVLNNLKISKNGLVKIENDLKLEKERFDNNQIILRSQIEQYKLDLDFTKLIEFKINTQLIENAKESIEKSIAALVLKQGQDEIQLEQFLYDQAKLSSELSEPEKAYQTYLDQINLWNQKNQELENEKEIINNELNFAKNELPVHLIGLYRKYIKQYKKLFQTYQEELDIYQEQYKPILDFVATEKDKIKSKKGFINFTAYIAIDRKKLYNSLLFYFDGRRQTFYNDELLDVVSSLEDCNQVSLILLQKKIIRLIKNKGKNPQQQFRDGMELLNFYSSLSDLDYLNIEYDIMLDDKKVNQLSPGERGALLIIFYLLIDKGDIPLVIDQPEDNLDNESVFEYLVPYIKKAKERRQIVIVTHNPNIAVVADAEQIIYSEIDKTQGNTVTYLSGAIEDEIINDKIVKVLEGTMPAFDNRTIKYYRE